MMRRAPGWMVLPAGLIFAGCASLPAQYATQPPQGRSAAEIAKDEARCEAYTKSRPRHLSYRACMVARSYAANMDMDELGWTIGVAQTEPHNSGEVIRDMEDCDRQANATKESGTVPPLSSEQESIIAGQAPSAAPGSSYQQRPHQARLLVACLKERGYKIVPRVAY